MGANGRGLQARLREPVGGRSMTDLAMRGQADTSIDPSVLDRLLMHGVSWTGAVKGLTQLLSWLIVIVVAHLLTPQDFGLVAMATMFLGLTATEILPFSGVNLKAFPSRLPMTWSRRSQSALTDLTTASMS